MRPGPRTFAYLLAATCVIGCQSEVERDLDRLESFVTEACACKSQACIDKTMDTTFGWAREGRREHRMKKAMNDRATRERVMTAAKKMMACVAKLAPDAKPAMPLFLEQPAPTGKTAAVAESPPTKSIAEHCAAGIEAPLDVLCMVGRPVDDVLGRCERKVGGACAVQSAAWFYCMDDAEAAEMVTLSVHSLWTGDGVVRATPDGPAIGATRNVKAADPRARKRTRDFLDGRLRQLGCLALEASEVTTTYSCGARYVELFAGSPPFVSIRAGTSEWHTMCSVRQ